MRSFFAAMCLIVGALAILASPANAQCPAFGRDTTCGAVITVIQTGNSPCAATGCASVSLTGQGPYDGSDDTLIGVRNNGNLPISSLELTSGNGIFSFDGDGVDTFGAPRNSRDTTGYGGPNAYFTNFTATSGTVNFITPIAPGNTGYFSLENSLGAATACSTIINNSVPKPVPFGSSPSSSPMISTTFTPKNGLTLAQAAKLCGFIEFDWQSTVTYFPQPAPYWYEAGSTTPATYPHNDPPLNGYAVNPSGQMPNAVKLPVYYNLFTAASDPLSLAFNEMPAGAGATMLSFYDAPGDPCLPGGLSSVRAYIISQGWAPQSCLTGVPATAPKPYESFTTHLVGIAGTLPGASVVDTGIGFDWRTTYNGTTGGITVLNTAAVTDPGSGTGGVTIVNVNEVTNYQYPKSFGVTAINGVSVTPPSSTSMLLSSDQFAAISSGLAYSRATQTFDGTLTITNISGNAVTGPFQIVFNSLTTGVTLANATSSFGGWPYLTVPDVGSLAPGESAIVSIEFKNPKNAPITFTPIPYSGSFN